jgi:hypothetical protein
MSSSDYRQLGFTFRAILLGVTWSEVGPGTVKEHDHVGRVLSAAEFAESRTTVVANGRTAVESQET